MSALDQAVESFNERMALQAHANDATIKNPFEDVSGQFGAPMGRTSFGTAPASGIRLVRARWVDGAYDQGGAYWGMPSKPGEYIYAAVDSNIPCQYCRYVRATSPELAREQLGISFKGDARYAKDFEGDHWDYLTTDLDLSHTLGMLYTIGGSTYRRRLKATTALMVWIEDGEYREVWATEDSANFLSTTTYIRLR